MLVLSRQRDETIMIGDNIEITIVDIRGDKVRLGITAPATRPVHRKEVYDAIQRENREAARMKTEDLGGLPRAGRPSVPPGLHRPHPSVPPSIPPGVSPGVPAAPVPGPAARPGGAGVNPPANGSAAAANGSATRPVSPPPVSGNAAGTISA
jgi:carbon storage regulator